MPVKFSMTGPELGQGDIEAFERRIGNRLPGDYRRFLLANNGGRPKPNMFANSSTGSLAVMCFFGIWDREFYDMDAEYSTMQGRWPSRFLSIAVDDFGNRFLMTLDPAESGAIYFWDHEREADEGEKPREDNLDHLADSFSDFWQRIEPDEDDQSDSQPRVNPSDQPEND